MASPKRIVLFGVVLVLLVAVGGVAGRAIRRNLHYGAIADEHNTTVRVDVGDRFSLKVPDRGASVGDSWTASTDPAGMVELVGTELVASKLMDRIFEPALGGGGGSRYFRYDAKRAGRVTITLSNCFQDCRNERTDAESRTVAWTVIVS